jgi:hypothetical protein
VQLGRFSDFILEAGIWLLSRALLVPAGVVAYALGKGEESSNASTVAVLHPLELGGEYVARCRPRGPTSRADRPEGGVQRATRHQPARRRPTG